MRVEMICGKCSRIMNSEQLPTGYVQWTCISCPNKIESPNILEYIEGRNI